MPRAAAFSQAPPCRHVQVIADIAIQKADYPLRNVPAAKDGKADPDPDEIAAAGLGGVRVLAVLMQYGLPVGRWGS